MANLRKNRTAVRMLLILRSLRTDRVPGPMTTTAPLAGTYPYQVMNKPVSALAVRQSVPHRRNSSH